MADGEKLVLKPGVVLPFLSNFTISNDGESFQFTDLDMSGKNIEQLNKTIEEAKEVYNVNLNTNGIGDPSALKELLNLMHLDLGSNKVKNLNVLTVEDNFPNLQWLDISNNKFTEFPPIKCPKLQYLDVSYNKLEKVNDGWTGHANLKVLKSVENKFKNLAVFKNCPKLEELYLARNKIAALSGYEGLPALKRLHLRRNNIEKIDDELAELPSLEYLNLRSNGIPNMEVMFKLFQYPLLKDLNVINCPVELAMSSINLFVAEVLIKFPKTVRFCKIKIEDNHRVEAVHLADFKWRKAEEARLEELEK